MVVDWFAAIDQGSRARGQISVNNCCRSGQGLAKFATDFSTMAQCEAESYPIMPASTNARIHLAETRIPDLVDENLFGHVDNFVTNHDTIDLTWLAPLNARVIWRKLAPWILYFLYSRATYCCYIFWSTNYSSASSQPTTLRGVPKRAGECIWIQCQDPAHHYRVWT